MKLLEMILVVTLMHLCFVVSAAASRGATTRPSTRDMGWIGTKRTSLLEYPSIRMASASSTTATTTTMTTTTIQDEYKVLAIRGGGGDIDLSEDDDDGIVLKKIRNIIRNVLDFGDKKLPFGSNLLRSCFRTLEKLTGVKLMATPKKAKKKSGKKKSKQASKAKEEESSAEKEEDEESEETKSTSTSTKKKSATKALKKPSATTQKHLTTEIKGSNPNYRIQRELKEFIKSPPPNLSVQAGSNIRVWIITMVGAEKTIYEGEVFKLRVSFPPKYPTVPPSVYFVKGHIPIHEHVYTNGDICLSLLGKDWRPTMTAQSIAVSILSILSSAQSKSLPMDNARHAGNKPGEYQKDWVYHDDNC